MLHILRELTEFLKSRIFSTKIFHLSKKLVEGCSNLKLVSEMFAF